MIILLFLPILAMLGALFALGYSPVVVPGRWLMKRRLTESADAWAPLGGAMGTVAGFLFADLGDFDRFALAPDHVRVTWRDTGAAFAFELWKPLFGGAVCAIALLMIARVWPVLPRVRGLPRALPRSWFPSPASVSVRSSSHRFFSMNQQTTCH